MLVKVYSTPACPYCDMVKKFFNKYKIKYKEINVADDEDGRKDMVNESGQFGVPVVVVSNGEEKVIVGYSPAELKRALKL